MTVLALTCLRNEAPYLLDWIAHHRALGVDHFLICTHDCDDGSDRLADALEDIGLVTHLPFQPRGNKTVQWQALRLLDARPELKSHDWAMFLDVDEYLNLPEPMAGIADMIARAEGADGIAIPWRLFGSAGQEDFEDRPVTARFTRAAPADLQYPLAHLFKSLIRPRAFRQLGVHRPRHRNRGGAPVWRVSNGTPLSPGLCRDDRAITLYGQPGLSQAPLPVLNHYSLRSSGEFLLKRDRGLPNHADRVLGAEYWAERNWNTVEDGTIGRFAVRAEAAKAALLRHAPLAEIHEKAVLWHRNRIAELLQDIENVRFVWRLGLLTGSTPPTLERTRAYIRAQMGARGLNG